MSKKVSGSVLLLTTLAFSLIIGGVLVLGAQDPQTQPAAPQSQPTRKPKTTTGKRKRGQMKMTAPTNETSTGDQTAPADASAAGQTTTPAQNMPAMTSTQTDLSGTYAGTFNCDALGLTGDTTLTINGNQFSTADGKTGRIVASTTRGYTAVALQTGDMAGATTAGATTGAATTAPQIVSLRAHHSGNRLTLTSVPGAATPCSFTTSRSAARRSRQNAAAAGTTVASPGEAGATPAAPAKPARTRRGSTRRGQSTTTPSEMPSSTNPTTQPVPENPTPSQTPSPAPTQTPSPEPNPAPSPEPVPVPSPSGSPTPMPNPSPSPTTTPSPTPSPSPRPRG